MSGLPSLPPASGGALISAEEAKAVQRLSALERAVIKFAACSIAVEVAIRDPSGERRVAL